MNITPRVQKAIDSLINAFNTDTLIPGHCAACAVGNLVATGMNATVEPGYAGIGFNAYRGREVIDNHSWSLELHFGKSVSDGQVRFTNFSVEELTLIENAFENATKIKYDTRPFREEPLTCRRKDQLKGLKAVVNTMLQIDNCTADIEEVFAGKIKPIHNQINES